MTPVPRALRQARRVAGAARRHARALVADLRSPSVAVAAATAPPAAPAEPLVETPVKPPVKPPREPRPAKALRRGYIYHGEFKYKIAYDPDIISNTVIDTISDGAYERFEARRVTGLVEDGDRVVELGAGLGFLSTHLLATKQIADYQAVEADPRLPAMIRRTHELNQVSGPLTIHHCVATCNQDMVDAGSVEFFVGEKFCASSLLGTVSALKHTVDVPVVSLAALVAEHRSNVLVCDIEGAETDVLNGTPLPTITKILMETHPHRIGLVGIRSLFRHLDALGFVYAGQHSSGNVCGFVRLDPAPTPHHEPTTPA